MIVVSDTSPEFRLRDLIPDHANQRLVKTILNTFGGYQRKRSELARVSGVNGSSKARARRSNSPFSN